MTPVVWLAGSGGALAMLAGWRERRRTRRAEADAVGWFDWTGVQLAGIGLVALAGLMALKS